MDSSAPNDWQQKDTSDDAAKQRGIQISYAATFLFRLQRWDLIEIFVRSREKNRIANKVCQSFMLLGYTHGVMQCCHASSMHLRLFVIYMWCSLRLQIHYGVIVSQSIYFIWTACETGCSRSMSFTSTFRSLRILTQSIIIFNIYFTKRIFKENYLWRDCSAPLHSLVDIAHSIDHLAHQSLLDAHLVGSE